MSGAKELYNSIIFIQKWQQLIRDIRDASILKLNDYCKNNDLSFNFSKGLPYPEHGIHYGTYIPFKSDNKELEKFIYFGFNFNLYDKKNVKSYPTYNVIGTKLNDFISKNENIPAEISFYMKAKQEQLIEDFIFGLALHGDELSDKSKEELSHICIEDDLGYFYVPIDTQLLYDINTVEPITNQILNICKKYIF